MVKNTEFWRHHSMPYVEARRASNSRTCYKPHMHSTVSIGAVDAGTSVLIDAGSMSKRLRPETVVWIPAHHRHSCNPLPTTAWSYQMLYVDPQWIGETFGGESSAVSYGPESIGIRLCEDAALYAEVSQVTRLLFSDASLDSKRTALAHVIAACQRAHWEDMPSAASSRYVSPALQTVLEKIQQNPGADFNWDELAGDAGLSRTQLIRAFSKVTGMTPHAWQQNVRINAAREQVRNGCALAEVAYQHGFADQAHFQRVFKSLAGTTPGNYRT